jgi:pimeloyl-[acyl-carrier protein] synthase
MPHPSAAHAMNAVQEHPLVAPVDMRHPAFRDDPHPLLRELRESTRVARDVLGIWLVLHHADVSAVLRSSQLSREIWRSPGYGQMRPFLADSTMERTTHQWMIFNDPPKHTRLRRLVGAAFKPGVVEAMRERITAVTDELLDALPAAANPDGSFDLMTGLAQPLPVRIICDVLGLPHEDFAQTKSWSDALSWIVEPVVRREQREAAGRAAEEMVAYLRHHIAQRRGKPARDDVLGLMVAASEAGHPGEEPLSDDELLGNLILMLIAGHETTTNLIGNGMLTLLRHPQELARLRRSLGHDPALMHTAVEEMLRYEGSVTTIARHTALPYTIGDTVVPPGQVLYGMLGAAHRDPAAFADPDRFDIGRQPNGHLAFGAGIHYCLGAPLARLEAEVAFTRLLQRYPHLEMADAPPRWRKLINLRGLESLRLRSAQPSAGGSPANA